MSTKILFSTNNMLGSLLIRAGTWSSYSHCDIVVGDGSVIGAVALNPARGVTQYPLETRLKDATHYVAYEVDADLERVVAAAKSQLGKAYDWLGCAGIAFHRDWRSTDKWFCSELAAWAFEQAGVPLVNPNLKMNRVTPETLLRSPLLHPTTLN